MQPLNGSLHLSFATEGARSRKRNANNRVHWKLNWRIKSTFDDSTSAAVSFRTTTTENAIISHTGIVRRMIKHYGCQCRRLLWIIATAMFARKLKTFDRINRSSMSECIVRDFHLKRQTCHIQMVRIGNRIEEWILECFACSEWARIERRFIHSGLLRRWMCGGDKCGACYLHRCALQATAFACVHCDTNTAFGVRVCFFST